jgi:signal transduction histidine kinase/PAS domain-containing protein
MFTTTIHNHSLCILFAACLTVVIGSIICARMVIKKKSAEANAKNLSILIHHLPSAWCCWYAGEEKVMASEKFLQLLGISGGHIMDLQDTYRLFGQSSLSQFQRALNHLYAYGGEFSLQLTLEHHQEREFVVNGSAIDIEQQKNSFRKNKSFSKKLIILGIQDITSTSSDLKKQQRKLSEIEHEIEILRQYAELLPIKLWFKDSQGRIKHCNSLYADALETSPQRVIAENIELLPKRNLNINNDSKKSTRLHAVIKGQRRLLEANEINVPSGVIGFAQDITIIEQWENTLQRHEQAQREILENLSNAIAIYGPDTHLQYFNSAYLKTFQLQESFLYSRPKFADVLEDLRKRRKMIEVENFKKHKDNRLALFNTVFEPLHEIHHQPDGSVLKMTVCPHALGGLLFVFEDISDKLSLERGYNTLLAVQKETIDNLHEGLAVVGTDLRLRLSNNACGRLLNLDNSSRKPGTHIAEFLEGIKPLLDEQSFHHWNSHIYALCENRQPSTETVDIIPQGKIQISYIPLPDGSHLFSFVDIYDRWKFEQSIKDSNEALENADRLKTNFISHVSYELRAPLNTIAGFVDILKNQYFGSLNERQMDYCQGISDSNQKLMQLITDMIDLASIEAGKLSLNYMDINLKKFLESCSALVGNRAQDQGVELNIINKSNLKEFNADEKRLKHVLFNLLINSLKFTLPGGEINLIAFDVHDEPNTLGLCVEDTGIGIKAEDQQKIFDMFEHGSSKMHISKKGVGLGLPLVKRLVELHNGKVFMVSKENEGTRIICHIPVRQSALI